MAVLVLAAASAAAQDPRLSEGYADRLVAAAVAQTSGHVVYELFRYPVTGRYRYDGR